MSGWTIAALAVLGAIDLPQLWRAGARRECGVWLVLAAAAIAVLVVKDGSTWFLADWLLEVWKYGA